MSPPITPPAMAAVGVFFPDASVGFELLDGVEVGMVPLEVEFEPGMNSVLRLAFAKPVAGAVTVAPPLRLTCMSQY